MDRLVTILGGGPAGASAAIAARLEGAAASIIDKSKFPRHKVCGEFFSPEIEPELKRLGVWANFLAAGPARVRRMKLHFGRREKSCALPEPAWALSRYAFDALLMDCARVPGSCENRPSNPAVTGGAFRHGAAPVRAGLSARGITRNPEATILATGRRAVEPRGRRLFGFKAHFEGPSDDAVELFFFGGCYVGVTAVEDGKTNVCGLGPENFLRQFEFDFDRVLQQSPALAARLAPLSRRIEWLSTGPLKYAQSFRSDTYAAGDALSFVDPFTGSGLLAAVKTGTLAGRAAARGTPPAQYFAECRAMLKKPFEIAAIFRKAIGGGWAEYLAGLIPGRVLFALTRPGK